MAEQQEQYFIQQQSQQQIQSSKSSLHNDFGVRNQQKFGLEVIDPPNNSELCFILENNDEISKCTVTLKHPGTTKDHIAYKLFTTHPRRYLVSPHQGLVGPESSAVIGISLSMEAKEVILEEYENVGPLILERVKDKFLVQSCVVPRSFSKQFTKNKNKDKDKDKIKGESVRSSGTRSSTFSSRSSTSSVLVSPHAKIENIIEEKDEDNDDEDDRDQDATNNVTDDGNNNNNNNENDGNNNNKIHNHEAALDKSANHDSNNKNSPENDNNDKNKKHDHHDNTHNPSDVDDDDEAADEALTAFWISVNGPGSADLVQNQKVRVRIQVGEKSRNPLIDAIDEQIITTNLDGNGSSSIPSPPPSPQPPPLPQQQQQGPGPGQLQPINEQSDLQQPLPLPQLSPSTSQVVMLQKELEQMPKEKLIQEIISLRSKYKEVVSYSMKISKQQEDLYNRFEDTKRRLKREEFTRMTVEKKFDALQAILMGEGEESRGRHNHPSQGGAMSDDEEGHFSDSASSDRNKSSMYRFLRYKKKKKGKTKPPKTKNKPQAAAAAAAAATTTTPTPTT